MFSQVKKLGLITLAFLCLSVSASDVAKRSLFLAAMDERVGELQEKTFAGLYIELGEGQQFRTLEFMSMVPLLCEGQYEETPEQLVLHYTACSRATDLDGRIEADRDTTQVLEPGLMSITVVLKNGSIDQLMESDSFIKYVNDDFSAALMAEVKLSYDGKLEQALAPSFGFMGDLTQMISLYQQNPQDLESFENENPDL